MKTPLENSVSPDDNAGVFDGECAAAGATFRQNFTGSTVGESPASGHRFRRLITKKALSRAHEAFAKWRVTPGTGTRRYGPPTRQRVA
jgi:hypothetical protein